MTEGLSELNIASFNISGGFYKPDSNVDYLDRKKSDDMDPKLLNDIIRIINEEDIDIICFQEIITTKRFRYIQTILEKTPLKFEDHFELSPCNLVKDANCGIAILSKYPIISSLKKLFTNPKISKNTASGNTFYTYDKGLLMASVDMKEKNISILTHHGFPFRRFNSKPENHKEIFIEFDNYIKELTPDIITGDFNNENFIDMMPYTKEKYKKTINEVTTDDGMKYDNILVKPDIEYSSKILKSFSDHFIIIDRLLNL